MHPFRAILASEEEAKEALEVEKKHEGDFDTVFRQVERKTATVLEQIPTTIFKNY